MEAYPLAQLSLLHMSTLGPIHLLSDVLCVQIPCYYACTFIRLFQGDSFKEKIRQRWKVCCQFRAAHGGVRPLNLSRIVSSNWSRSSSCMLPDFAMNFFTSSAMAS